MPIGVGIVPKFPFSDLAFKRKGLIITDIGDVAQLGERGVRNAVSIPTLSLLFAIT